MSYSGGNDVRRAWRMTAKVHGFPCPDSDDLARLLQDLGGVVRLSSKSRGPEATSLSSQASMRAGAKTHPGPQDSHEQPPDWGLADATATGEDR